jgi:gallate dioxygenase
MARIIGGIGTSHTPTIGYALDARKSADPAWTPVFEAYAPVRAWLATRRPDAAIVIYNDHVTSFFFDHYSAFALGVGNEWHPADEGGGARDLPPLPGHAALAQHLGRSLMAAEFDLSFFQGRPLDHGCFSPLSMIRGGSGPWPMPVVPLAVGVLQLPIPTARRCFKLGQALRAAVESFPEPLNVVVIGTGGLSHQVHGERAGFNNPEWDQEFLDAIVADPERLAGMSHEQFALRGGWESVEVIMWLIMRGALSERVRVVDRRYTLPSMTGIATLVLEDPAPAGRHPPAPQDPPDLNGTYPFTLARSTRAYALNRFLQRLVEPAHRAGFLADPQASMTQAGLSDAERRLIDTRNWIGLIREGAIFFGLEKLAAVLHLPNAVVYAGMRGETLEQFQASRNAPGALYSVGRPSHDDVEQPEGNDDKA